MKCNYHTHSKYCDGKGELEEFVKEAILLQYDHVGFSSHAPVLYENDFSIREEEIPAYLKEIQSLREQQNQVALFSGLECDFIPGVTRPLSFYKELYHMDYVIGGVHLVKPSNRDELWFIDGSKRETYDSGLANLFDHNAKKAVTAFWEQTFEMIETEKFDIIAHLDKIKMHNQNRFFEEGEEWYKKLALHCVELIRKNDIIVEINTRGLYKKRCDDFYPSRFILQEISKKDIPCVVSIDAHQPLELGLFHDEAVAALQNVGIKTLVKLNERGGWNRYDLA